MTVDLKIGTGILSVNGFSFNVYADKTSILNRNILLSKQNKDGSIYFEQGTQSSVNIVESKMLTLHFLQRDMIEFYSKYPFYSEVKKVFEANSSLESAIIGMDKHGPTDILYLSTHKEAFPKIKEVLIDVGDTMNGIPHKYYTAEDFKSLVAYDMATSSFSFNETVEVLADQENNTFIKTVLLNSLKKDIQESIDTYSSSSIVASLVQLAKEISTYSLPKNSSLGASYYLDRELKTMLFGNARSTPSLFDDENDESSDYLVAKSLIDGLDINSVFGKTFYSLVGFVNKIVRGISFEEISMAYHDTIDISSSFYIDKNVFKNKHGVVSFLNSIDRLFSKAVELYSIKDLSSANAFLSIYSKNPIFTVEDICGCVDSFKDFNGLRDSLKKLPANSIFNATLPSSELFSAISNSETIPDYIDFEIIQSDQDIDAGVVRFVGIKKNIIRATEETAKSLGFKKVKKLNLNDASLFSRFSLTATNKIGYSDRSISDYFNEQIEQCKNISSLLIKTHELILQKKSTILGEFSTVSGIGIKERKFPNPSILNPELSPMVSVVEICNSQSMIDSMHFLPIMDGIVRSIAAKAGLDIPRHKNIIVKPSCGTKSILNYLKEEHISGSQNLGMLKFKFAPTLDIREESEKNIFFEAMVKEHGELLDMEDFRKILDSSSYVCVGTKKEFFGDLVVARPPVVLLDGKGKTLKELNMTIYEYIPFLEKYEILNFDDIVYTPSARPKDKIKIAKSVGVMFVDAYIKMLGKENYSEAFRIASSLLAFRGTGWEAGIEKSKEFFRILEIFFEPMVKENILRLDIKKARQEISALPLEPSQKNILLNAVLNSKKAVFSKAELDRIIIKLERKSPEIAGIANNFFDNIREQINSNIEKAKKEAKSFFYISDLFLSYKNLASASTQEDKNYYLQKVFTAVKLWAKEALGLFDDQIETAINAIVLNEKRENVEFFIFHSMGTGKTRLALFYQLLYAATNPEDESIFAIQTKNQDDIADQVEDMLPSLKMLVNILSRESLKNESINTPVPIGLTRNIFPNLFSGGTKGIFISDGTDDIKKILSRTYIAEVSEIADWYDTYPAKIDSYVDANVHPMLQPLKDEIRLLYKNIILAEISKINSVITPKMMEVYYQRAYINLVSTITYIDKYFKKGNISLDDESLKSIFSKAIKTYSDFFESALSYEQIQKKNKLSLASQTVFDYFPKESLELVEVATTSNGKANKIATSKNVASIGVNEESYKKIEKDYSTLSKALKSQYAPLKTSEEKVWLFYNSAEATETQFDAIRRELISALTIELLPSTLKLKTESLFAYSEIIKKIADSLDATSVYDDMCSYIRNDSVPLSAEVFNINDLAFDSEQLQKEVDEILANDPSDECAKTYASFQSIFNKNSLALILNSYFFNSVLTDFVAPRNNYKEKTRRFSLARIGAQDAEIEFLCKILPQNIRDPYYIFGSKKASTELPIDLYSLYTGSFVAMQDKNDPQKHDLVPHVGDSLIISYSGKRLVFSAYIGFDDIPLKKTYSINFASSSVYKKDSGNPLVITDEGHKNKIVLGGQEDADMDIKESIAQSGNKRVVLTGTPTNGTASSVAKTIYHDKSIMESKMPQLGAAAGIQLIRDRLYASFLEVPELLKDFTIASEAALANNSSENKTLLISKLLSFYKEKFEDIKEMAIKARSEKNFDLEIIAYRKQRAIFHFIHSSHDALLVAMDRCISELKKGLPLDDALYASIPSSHIVEYPGITNPKVFANEIGSDFSKEISVNPGKDRVYNFLDLQNVLDGDIPMLSPHQNTEKISRYFLHIPYLTYLVFKSFKQHDHYEIVCKMIENIAENIFYNKDAEISEIALLDIRKLLVEEVGEAESLKILPSYQDLKKELTTKNTGGSDSFIRITKEKVAIHQLDDWDNMSIVKKCASIVLLDYVNLLLKNKSLFIEKFLSYFSDPAIKSKKATMLQELFANELLSREYLSIENQRAFIQDGEFEQKHPILSSIEINLAEHFKNVLIDDENIVLPSMFRLLHGRESEVLAEIFSDCTDRITELAINNKNALLLTTRTSVFQFKFLELLEELLRVGPSLSCPYYILANTPSDEHTKLIFNSLNREKLADNNIFVIMTNPNNLSHDYNCKIPSEANFTIISNYESCAEGFRFPRVNQTVVAGQTSEITSALQAMSRTFFPGLIYESQIVLSGAKTSLSPYVDHKGVKANDSFLESRKSVIDMLASGEPATALNYKHIVKRANIDKIDFSCEPPITKTKSKFKRIADGIISSLKFMDATTNGIEIKTKSTFFKTDKNEAEIESMGEKLSVLKSRKTRL